MKEIRITEQEWPPTLGIALRGDESFTRPGLISYEDYDYCMRVLTDWKQVQEILHKAVEAAEKEDIGAP